MGDWGRGQRIADYLSFISCFSFLLPLTIGRVCLSFADGKRKEISGRQPITPTTSMHYLFAIICPPLAVLACQKPTQALLNLILTLCFWIPGMIHAMMVVKSHRDERRLFRLIGEMQNHRISWALKKV
jgi:uncharacterized membrane protein YqaE (UPF0057 family)